MKMHVGSWSLRGVFVFSAFCLHVSLYAQDAKIETGLEFIDTRFENASPLWYETTAEGVIDIRLNYDHERAAPNRAAGHVHFQLQGRAGKPITLEFKNLDNIYNGRPGSVAPEFRAASVSEDGIHWRSIPTVSLPGNRVQLTVPMTQSKMYVARMEPYRLSDLDALLNSLNNNPLVTVTPIGKTVEGRTLEIIRIGNADAPRRVFLRARAHPWEAGGNWVVQGLIRRLLQNDDRAQIFRSHYQVYIMPMANKDGVVRGMTRFNLRGKDLNRDWNQPADPLFAPENAALEQWLQQQIQAGQAPHLALELHNDGSGLMHISNFPRPGLDRYLKRIAILETLFRKHTWFTEGTTKNGDRRTGTLADGFNARYGIDSIVQELNCHWIAGRKDFPTGQHWMDFGAALAEVFDAYFALIGKP